MENRVVIFLHGAEYDRMHEAFSIAVAASSTGRPVEIFFSWWALDRLLSGDLEEPFFGKERVELAEEFAEKGFPTVGALLQAARQSGKVKLFACTGSLAILGRNPLEAQQKVDELIGWAAILDRTAGVADRFFF